MFDDASASSRLIDEDFPFHGGSINGLVMGVKRNTTEPIPVNSGRPGDLPLSVRFGKGLPLVPIALPGRSVEGGAQDGQEEAAGNHFGPEAPEMGCVDLAIEENEAQLPELRRQGYDGDLRGVAHPGEHGLPEETTPQGHAIEPSCQLAIPPCLGGMGEALLVETAVGSHHQWPSCPRRPRLYIYKLK